MHDQTDLWVCRKFASAQNGNIHWRNYEKGKAPTLQPAGGWMSVLMDESLMSRKCRIVPTIQKAEDVSKCFPKVKKISNPH